MSWNKNAFGYLMWLIYVFVTGMVLLVTISGFCAERGMHFGWGIGISAGIGILGGILVFCLRRWTSACKNFVEKKRNLLVVFEGVLVLGFTLAGIWLRVMGMAAANWSSEYYEAAQVVAEQRMPRIVHGASYLYVEMLHGLLLLLGNHYAVGIWAQIALQVAALFVFFFVMRKSAGALAALSAFGFFMCAPYMVQNALVLSPVMLYFLIFTVCATLIAAGFQRKRENVAAFLMGIIAAFGCYLDISGILLLIFALWVILCGRREEEEKRKKFVSVLLCLAGAAAGFLGYILSDALLSGKSFLRVLEAWLALYRPEDFRLPVTLGVSELKAELWILAGGLTLGIFSFWCDRQRERISFGVLALCGVVAAGCFGMFAEENLCFFYTYFLLVLLAGIGLAQCLRVEEAEKEAEETEPEEKGEDQIVIEDLDAAADEKAGAEEVQQEPNKVQLLKNPLPLPKKHVKRVMDYPLQAGQEDNFDYPVGEDDDYDF